MFKSAFAVLPLVRNVTVCGFLTVALAACGSSGGSSSDVAANTTAAADTTSLVSPNTGYIDRTGDAGSTAATASNTTAAAGSTTATSPTPTAATEQPTNGPAATTVASSNKTSTTNTGVSTSSPTPSTGAATLDWTAPIENSDGTVLTNLAGYTVYYGTSPDNLTQTVKITNPGLTAYTMTNLPSGTWYFSITAYSADGSESTRSGVVSTKI
jgi:hypothetical protein